MGHLRTIIIVVAGQNPRNRRKKVAELVLLTVGLTIVTLSQKKVIIVVMKMTRSRVGRKPQCDEIGPEN